LGAGEREITLTANPEEREALARRFEIAAVAELRAVLRVAKAGSAPLAVRIEGRMRAVVEQTCVVTLDPVHNQIETAVSRLFREGHESDAAVEVDLPIDDADVPDILEGSVIDLGEVIAEQLGLDLDPFPRKPGVVFEGYSDPPDDDIRTGDAPRSPFAKLGELKNRMPK